MIRENNHLTFIQTHDTGKTKVFCVQVSPGGTELGEVLWSSALRSYAFLPTAHRVFLGEQLLSEITTFIKFLMAERKKAK